MDIITQQAICELFIGSIIKHSFYVFNKKDTVATVDDLNNVPYFYTITGMPEKLCEIITVNHIEAGQTLDLKLNNGILRDISISVPISNYTKYIFSNMVDGNKNLKEIFAAVREELKQNIPDSMLINEVKSVFEPFITAGVLLLKSN